LFSKNQEAAQNLATSRNRFLKITNQDKNSQDIQSRPWCHGNKQLNSFLKSGQHQPQVILELNLIDKDHTHPGRQIVVLKDFQSNRHFYLS